MSIDTTDREAPYRYLRRIPWYVSSFFFLGFAGSLCQGAEVTGGLSIERIELSEARTPTITWVSQAGVSYVIERTASLFPLKWTRVSSAIKAGGERSSFTDPEPVSSGSRFYRVVQVGSGAPGGLTFTNPGPGGGSFLMSIAIHPENPDLFYVGGDIEGPFVSRDGGQSYERISGNLSGGDWNANIYAAQNLTLDPGNPDRLYMASWDGLYRTDDQGRTWVKLPLLAGETPADSIIVSAVGISPFDSNLILVGNGDTESNTEGISAIFRSDDAGKSFTDVSGDIFVGDETAVHGFVFDPRDANVVYAATGEGVFKSTDGALSWQGVNQGLPVGPDGYSRSATGMTGVASSDGFVLYVSLRPQSRTDFIAAGVFRSTDGARSWTDITGDLPRVQTEEEPLAYSYWHIVASSADPNVVYVGTLNETAFVLMGLYRTRNALTANGKDVSWDYIWDPETDYVRDPGWMNFDWANDLHVNVLGISQSNPDILYAGTDNLLKSTDGGRTWTEVYSTTVGPSTYRGRGLELMEPFDVAVDPNDPNRWWVGYDDMGLFRTDDAGKTFVRLDEKQEPESLGATDCACRIVLDPEDSGIVYVGRTGGELDLQSNWRIGKVFKSIDNGRTWQRLGETAFGNGGEGGRPVLVMLPGGTPEQRSLLAAIYGQGLFLSTDSGESWVPASSGFSDSDRERIWTMVLDPSDPDTLYAGINNAVEDATRTHRGAIYRSDDSGRTWTKLGNGVPDGQTVDLAVAADGTLYAAVSPVFVSHEEGSASMPGGLYRSKDRGNTWTRVLKTFRADFVDVAAGNPSLVVACVSSRFDYRENLNAGVYASRDGGETFNLENRGVTETRFWFVKVHPQNPDMVFVGTGGAGLFVGTGLLP